MTRVVRRMEPSSAYFSNNAVSTLRGLSREALVKYSAALAKMPWALRHRRRFALKQAGDVLASAERSDLTGRLNRQLVTSGVCGARRPEPMTMAGVTEACLMEQLLDDVARDGADLALMSRLASMRSSTGIELSITMTAGCLSRGNQSIQAILHCSPRLRSPYRGSDSGCGILRW